MSQHSTIDTTVRGLGYELVDVERAPAGLLRVTIDHPPQAGPARFINVDDCEKVTRQLQHVLEVEGLAYERLEVSSPGLDRPLKSKADFARFEGEQVELTLKVPFKGRKRFRGELLAREDGWRLVLAPTASVAAAKRHAASRSAQGRRAAAEAAGIAPVSLDPSAAADEVRVLDFSMDEVREARLVPVIDFKGRRAAPAAADAHEARVAEETDGGLRQ
ncbi:MAG: ribosome maturation factor RimP [Pseudomonadota bacterium]|nr:ribosome maturation factor RimP [Pseudomonadota bacterium]